MALLVTAVTPVPPPLLASQQPATIPVSDRLLAARPSLLGEHRQRGRQTVSGLGIQSTERDGACFPCGPSIARRERRRGCVARGLQAAEKGREIVSSLGFQSRERDGAYFPRRTSIQRERRVRGVRGAERGREREAMGADDHLTPEQLEFYETNGYLVLENYASEEECKALIKRIGELVDNFDPATIAIFSTKAQGKNTGNYFMESASNISFFFEERAFDEEQKLKQPKSLSINKVGHALHDLDPLFRDFSRSEKMKALVASLGYRKPLPVQSMYIFKQPGIGGEVVPHQDSTFLYTEPHSTTGVWIALEDANKGNGCLWALPGSHKGEVARRYIVEKHGVKFDNDVQKYDESKFVPLEMKAGSLVVLHGSLVHQSFENTSPKSRHAYSVHVVEGDGPMYLEENWIQRDPSLPFEPLYIQ